ncbi:hypothetical protein H9L39_05495 [Fusarium oxysporum f. sp. albedinis]|nr:hypothetical protein H9L39_05495 [Fusarium oxysporum f. sp. albedinis]
MSSSSQLVSNFRLASSIIPTLDALSIRLSQFLVPSPIHLGWIKNSVPVSTHHQLPERGSAVSTPRELPEIKSRTNDGPEIGRALRRVREKFSSNFTSTLDVIVQIVDQLPHSIRYLQ